MTLGEKLSRLRQGRGYAEVARAAECSAPTIRELEAGVRSDPSVRIIARLARFFGVPLDWLADDTQDWPPPATEGEKTLRLIESVLTDSGLTGKLTEPEMQFLSLIRSLPDDLRQRFIDRSLGYADGLLASEEVRLGKHQPGEAPVAEAASEVLRRGKRKSG